MCREYIRIIFVPIGLRSAALAAAPMPKTNVQQKIFLAVRSKKWLHFGRCPQIRCKDLVKARDYERRAISRH